LGPHGNVSRPTSRPQRNTPHKIWQHTKRKYN
jgi:hypothetical protein